MTRPLADAFREGMKKGDREFDLILSKLGGDLEAWLVFSKMMRHRKIDGFINGVVVGAAVVFLAWRLM